VLSGADPTAFNEQTGQRGASGKSPIAVIQRAVDRRPCLARSIHDWTGVEPRPASRARLMGVRPFQDQVDTKWGETLAISDASPCSQEPCQ